MKSQNCIATKHAYQRAKERLGWKKRVLDKMMEKAYAEGFQHADTNGAFRKYLNHLWTRYRNCENVRIYGENIFFFSQNVLITVYRLDNQYIKHLDYMRAAA